MYVFMIIKVVVSLLITKSGDRMRFGCQIWGPKDEVNYVNDHGMLDLPEKSVKHFKKRWENMFVCIIFARPSLKVLCLFEVCFVAQLVHCPGHLNEI